MYKLSAKILLLFFISFLSNELFGQEAKFFNRLDSSQRHAYTKNVFLEIESGISTGKVSTFSGLLKGQTYLSLSNGVNGYYSSNQTYYILEDFFNLYRVISFKMQNVKADDNVPYATGVYYYDFRGKKGSARVFISLSRSSNGWKISQLTIN